MKKMLILSLALMSVNTILGCNSNNITEQDLNDAFKNGFYRDQSLTKTYMINNKPSTLAPWGNYIQYCVNCTYTPQKNHTLRCQCSTENLNNSSKHYSVSGIPQHYKNITYTTNAGLQVIPWIEQKNSKK